MGDIKVGEAFKDKCFITVLATGAAATLLADVSCTLIDESGNRSVEVVAEEGNGWYTCSFTPDAAGTWATEWGKAANPADYVFHYPYKEFKAGGGVVGDVYTDTQAIVADTNELQGDWVNGGRLDLLVDAVKAKTDNLPADPADESSLETAITNAHTTTNAKIDVVDGYHDVPAQDAAANVVVRDVVGNKTDTVAGTSLVGLVKAVKAKTDALPADPADDSDLDAAIAVIDGFLDVPVADTNDDVQIRDVVGRKTDTANTTINNTSSLMRYLKGAISELASVRARTDHHLITRTWFSPIQETLDLHAVAANESLPSVVLPNITGTISEVYAGIVFCMKEATTANANGVDGAQHIQVKESVGGAYTDAIAFVDDALTVAASTREGGTCIIDTTHEIHGQVAAFNKTYNFQWTSGKSHADHLRLSTVQTFLIVSYY